MELVKVMAREACVGGKSAVRSSDRARMIGVDQLCGQLGVYAFYRMWTGRPYPHEYLLSRYFANMYKTVGDGGSDVPPANIDIKTSCKRVKKDPWSYYMLVDEREFYPSWIYVQCLVNEIKEDAKEAYVDIMGWAESKMLVRGGCPIFPQKYAIQCDGLNPFPQIRWIWRPERTRRPYGDEVRDT
jgi:hypothetical protein